MVTSHTSITTLTPSTFRVHVVFKVIELMIASKTKHEPSDSLITIFEYLVADESGCIILNTKSALDTDKVYEITTGYTRVIEGSLRLYCDDVNPASKTLDTVNTENNRSFIQLERKNHY